MTEANCREMMVELVELARNGAEPGSGVRAHLKVCPQCRVRWEDERRLTSELRILRDAALHRRSAAARQNQILREFDLVRRPSSRPAMPWLAAAAAVLVLVAGVVELRRPHPAPGQLVRRSQQVASVQENPDIDGDNSGFIDVPYAPPLATGELVSVVRTRLQPTALARMGLSVGLGYGSEIPADVMVGEDGIPRAVRLVETMEF